MSTAKPKLLMILPRVPWPLEKGDKLRAFHQLRVLSKDYNIHLFALNEGQPHPDAEKMLKPFTQSVHFYRLSRFSRMVNVFFAWLNGKPIQVGYFYNRSAHRLLNRIRVQLMPDVQFCQLARSAEYAMRSDGPKVIDLQDAFSAGVKRRLDKAAWYLKPLFRMEYRRMLRYERRLAEHFDQLSIISETDRELIPLPSRERIQIVPNGVDLDFFHPMDQPARFDLVFTGNMAYPPNIDAAVFLVREIMPLVWKEKAGVSVLIAGANPHNNVKGLAGDHVKVSGWMDDIRDAYAQSRVFIAPMRIGTGMQNKLLEAMAMRLPCITTPLANKPIGTKPEQELLCGENPEELASHILCLLRDSKMAQRFAQAGHGFVTSKYSWEGATSKLNALIQLAREEN